MPQGKLVASQILDWKFEPLASRFSCTAAERRGLITPLCHTHTDTGRNEIGKRSLVVKYIE